MSMDDRLEVIAVPRWVVISVIVPLMVMGVAGAVTGAVSVVRTVYDNASAIRELKVSIDALAHELRREP